MKCDACGNATKEKLLRNRGTWEEGMSRVCPACFLIEDLPCLCLTHRDHAIQQRIDTELASFDTDWATQGDA